LLSVQPARLYLPLVSSPTWPRKNLLVFASSQVND
jgi:hypothetical protein